MGVKREAVVAEETHKEKKLAEMLRNMDRKDRNKILDSLEQQDPQVVNRIRELLYKFEDLRDIEDRSLQKLLGEIETQSLCTALNGAEQQILDKVIRNLSKRARESLLEEIELLGRVGEEELAAARKEVAGAIQRLDQAGELVML
jgi:flagellar motor switch protein FliG